jgi:hypothetical protein
MKKLKTLKVEDVKGRMPTAAQYNALKGMCYSPSVRDLKRKARKQARQNLKQGVWD